ncbi:hypothetical protein LEP1GSC188_2360 [Leptospira weilii serovar Topaz str. LT2116]|uniref:Uncharacterized protein n=1 Tax=Leptospira weilii serovar Topaz str. LT2116 TaxID=1088540 RepID=M3FMP9_9LEPT|nr:hypothetical protein LEP1GSC188_2360 [Leptospira weilii serovar Topaz str. LT2116]
MEISRSTLSNTAIQVFEKLSPMIEDVRRELSNRSIYRLMRRFSKC